MGRRLPVLVKYQITIICTSGVTDIGEHGLRTNLSDTGIAYCANDGIAVRSDVEGECGTQAWSVSKWLLPQTGQPGAKWVAPERPFRRESLAGYNFARRKEGNHNPGSALRFCGLDPMATICMTASLRIMRADDCDRSSS